MARDRRDRLVREFESPGAAWRGKPFWAWNGRLDEAELRRQLRIMKAMGLGGAFLHARVGLATPYLGREWFRLVRACVEEARSLGIEAWLYDEDRWPSGAAGGIVTADPRCRQRRLALQILPAGRFRPRGDELAIFVARVRGGAGRTGDRTPAEARSVRPWRRGEARPGEKVLVFRERTAEPSPWYNGRTYLDTLSPRAVRRFIGATHEAYRRAVGDAFGGVVPGIFTDEPNRGTVLRPDWTGGGDLEIPWTEGLPRLFRRRFGYDLLAHLPALFFDVDGETLPRARRDYHELTTERFVEGFAGQIGRWCEGAGIALTGHVLMEESLSSQTAVVGSAMRFYAHMQVPGVDVLTQYRPEYTTVKQAASVARQMGRRWVLSELYGCTGWDFGFEGHKAVGDWQAALGVNLRCPHLAWYTMEGEAKRDYPASISFQSPWWRLYHHVEDYFARVGVFTSRGEPVRDLLVIHPVESMWARTRIGWLRDPDVAALDRAFEALLRLLLENHIDFDYGDEALLERLAAVSGRTLRVGRAAYRAVLVSGLRTIRASTLGLLEGFLEAGGSVFFHGPVPERVDCAPSSRPRDLAARAIRAAPSRRGLLEALRERIRCVRIRDETGAEFAPALSMLRRDGRRAYLFLVNTDRSRGSGPLRITVPFRGRVAEWDARTGERFRAGAHAAGRETIIRTSLAPSGSRLFSIDPRDSARLPRRPALREVRRRGLAPRAWPIQLDEPNAIVLDRARWSLGGGRMRGPEEILRIDRHVRDRLGLPHRGGAMVQPWARRPARRPRRARVDLAFAFDVRALPGGPLELVLERPERFEAAVNGRPLPAGEGGEGWWIDPSLRRIPLAPSALRSGRNEITLAIRYGPDDGLEAVYLTGAFGAAVRRGREIAMTEPPARLAPGDWTRQGLPFYSGSVTYRARTRAMPRRGERVFLVLPGFRASAVTVEVDGREAGCLPWPPHELDLTDALRGGAGEIGIRLWSSRRNLFGPLHLADRRPLWIGPEQFVARGARWSEAYRLVPYGLMEAPYLSFRR